MEIMELLIIVTGLIAATILSIRLIAKVTIFYRTKYGFSIWSGTLLLFVSMAIIAVVENDKSNNHILLFIISGAIAIFTLVQDIRLSGIVCGALGFVFQIVMTFAIVFLLLIMLACFLGRIVIRQTRRIENSIFGLGEEIRYAVILLPVFIRVS